MEGTGELSKHQANPVETARQTPIEKSPDMAHPIDSGQFGGIRGALATVRERLRSIGGVSHVPPEQITPAVLIRKMKEKGLDVTNGFTQRDAVRALNYINPEKDASPAVFQKTTEAISQIVSLGGYNVISSEPTSEPLRYIEGDPEVLRKIAYPEPIQQAKPR